jgi:hypothetical protein
MVSKLIRLYPARWRHRYGDEMTQLLADLAPLSRIARLRIGLDLLRGAVSARLSRDHLTTGGPARAVRAAAVTAAAGWLPPATVIALGSAVFPSAGAGADWIYLLAMFLTAGAAASRACPRPRAWPAACAVSGAVMAVLLNATYAVIDNACLSIISRDQEKTAAFRASGMTSLRDYLNHTLTHQIPGTTSCSSSPASCSA